MSAETRFAPRTVVRIAGGVAERIQDPVAVERPLEIRIGGRALAVTLRTPGHDRELALGFLAAEGVIERREQVEIVSERAAPCEDEPDTIELGLAPGTALDWTRLERNFAATSACGLCGRAHVVALRAGIDPMTDTPPIEAQALAALAERARAGQVAFTATGGLHAAVWADRALEIQVTREDVGRHNAVDKIAGYLVERGRYPAGEGVLWVSGRAGAEIVLKAARARIPVLAAVGAPSSLAIALAEAARLTLIGFLRENRMNVYCGLERVTGFSA